MKKLIFLFVAFLLVFSSCKKDQPEPILTGQVTGKVVSMNETTPISMAMVFIDIDGEIYMTFTKNDGTFTLDAPSGTHDLYVESGQGKIFRTVISVDIPKDGEINSLPTLKLQQVSNLAYITGTYDNIETIVSNLGYTATQITISDLDNLTTLQNYSAIFLNCESPIVMDAGKYANLKSFVEGGGSLYVSDYAIDYISGFVDSISTVRTGMACTVNSNILDVELQSYVGTAQFDIVYNLDGWSQITYLDPKWETLVQSNVTMEPLATRLYTTGSGNKEMLEQDWVTICHIPPGNPSNAHTITISVNALPAHLAHGDNVGACTGNGGTIYYTTFHNEIGGTSPEIQKILEYFILNL